MELLESEKRVIAAAAELSATLGNDPTHTVAAAAMDSHGRIHTAVNVHHFTGGPCAELVVLGVAAAAASGPLVMIAAAGGGGRELLAPCGRCRQVIVDLHPDARIAIPTDEGAEVVPILTLLPSAYRQPDLTA
jgi:cytidine deaminase